MICDTGLVDKPYGRKLWQALPPMRRTRERRPRRSRFSRPASNKMPPTMQEEAAEPPLTE